METDEVESQTEEKPPIICPICQSRNLFFVGKVHDRALPVDEGTIRHMGEDRPHYQGYRWDTFICMQCNYVGYLLPREDLARLQEWAEEQAASRRSPDAGPQSLVERCETEEEEKGQGTRGKGQVAGPQAPIKRCEAED